MNHNWSSVGRIQGFDFFQEFQHANRCERHPKIRPAGEVELCDEPWSFASLMELQEHPDSESDISFFMQRLMNKLPWLFMASFPATLRAWLEDLEFTKYKH